LAKPLAVGLAFALASTELTTLIANLVKQDIRRGHGFCLIDPHGDLAESLKSELGEHAVFWDVANPECPFGYNPLIYVAEEYRPLVGSGIIDAFKKQWSDAWGVRMEHLLRNAILALLSRPNSSLADIVPMFTDKAFRREVLQTMTDAEVRKFWCDEYPKMNYKNAFDGVAPIANKLGGFLSNPVVRKALCYPKHPIRFRSLMDEGRPIIVNLSKGRLGADVSEVLGGLILSMIANAAMTREDVRETCRRPFIVYVDQFPTYTTETLANMLSELRKYRVGLVLAGQFIAGIKSSITEAIFGNQLPHLYQNHGRRSADQSFQCRDTQPFLRRSKRMMTTSAMKIPTMSIIKGLFAKVSGVGSGELTSRI